MGCTDRPVCSPTIREYFQVAIKYHGRDTASCHVVGREQARVRILDFPDECSVTYPDSCCVSRGATVDPTLDALEPWSKTTLTFSSRCAFRTLLRDHTIFINVPRLSGAIRPAHVGNSPIAKSILSAKAAPGARSYFEISARYLRSHFGEVKTSTGVAGESIRSSHPRLDIHRVWRMQPKQLATRSERSIEASR